MATSSSQNSNSIDPFYETIRASGQVITLDRDETFENKLIDVSTGESVSLHVTGANSVIRNVGFTGLYHGDEFVISIDAGTGDVLVENVYMGDGATRDGGRSVHGPGAAVMHRSNQADVTFRRCNVQGFPNNGFHCSHTATGPSSVHFDSCFGKNNGVATFRCAGGDDLVENCVAYTDETEYGHDDGPYVETNGRPVWVWNGDTVTIRDSYFADGPYPHALVAGANDAAGRVSFESGGYRGSIQRTCGSVVDVGADVSDDPDLSIPDGVPTTAEAAASRVSIQSAGEANSDGDRFPHAIVFDGSGTDDPSSYSFEATASREAIRHDAPISGADVVRGQPVHGVVDDARDAYWFAGSIDALSIRGDATVSVQFDVRERTERNGSCPL
ncbi:hypothetical protein OB920_15150 [Halobacteria archaeon HArc-gm2]|nr:hypothetical protein [Halobacteria archaeon HArc-gm2]